MINFYLRHFLEILRKYDILVSVSAINPTRQIATANAGIDQGQKNVVENTWKQQKALLGDGTTSGQLRQELLAAKLQGILSREQVEAWLNEALSEQALRKQLINIASA